VSLEQPKVGITFGVRYCRMKLMPMAKKPMAVIAADSEREEAGTEVMMATESTEVMMAPAVDLLNQRRGLYLLRHASNRSRHRRTRHQPQPKRASDSAEQCCLPHICLLRVPVRRARAKLGAARMPQRLAFVRHAT
jgi:hypothetical protein